MKTLKLLPLLMILLLAGCIETNMKFQPTVDLKDKYDQSSKDSNLTIYYNANGGMLNMAVQNTGNIYMKNLTINYDECCQMQHQGPGVYNYKNLGNLKNRTHKTMSLQLPDGNIKTVTLKYSFVPVREDSFLVANDSYAGTTEEDTINGMIILYIGK